MGKETGIAWCHHTFNPTWGCSKVSQGCKFCYAETLSHRFGDDIWGVDAPRKTFGEKHWNEPVRWNKAAEKEGVRKRVFCGSMCDIFEAHETTSTERVKLWPLIKATPQLDWLLLTKRPENITQMLPEDWGNGYDNVWLGTSTENQDMLDLRTPILAKIPARVRFLSAEPLLTALNLNAVLTSCRGHRYTLKSDGKTTCDNGCGAGFSVYQDWAPPGIDPQGVCPNEPSPYQWVIFGGESGTGVRPMEIDWVRRGIKQCRDHNVSPFVKQMGVVLAKQLGLEHKKGEDMSEWAEDIQIQEFPCL